MKVNSINSYTNFKGYSDVIGTGILLEDGSYMECISAILNDEGEKDLTKFHQLQKLNGDLREDCLTFFRCVDAKGKEAAFLNDIAMYTGDELLKLENRVGKDVTKDEFAHVQGIQMKAYTFLTNFMERLSNENNCIYIKDVNKIMAKTTQILLKYTHNVNLSSYIALTAREGSVPFQPIARNIYNALKDNMVKFFKL